MYREFLKISHRIDAIFTAHIRQVVKDINPFEAAALVALAERQPLMAKELAAEVCRATTSFTATLDRLEDVGYLERRPNSKDRRAVNIVLTQKGLELVRALKPHLADAEQEAMFVFTTDPHQTFIRYFAASAVNESVEALPLSVQILQSGVK